MPIFEGSDDEAYRAITYNELKALSKSGTPAVRATARAALQEIRTLNLAVDELDKALFERPTTTRRVAKTLEDGTKAVEDTRFYIGERANDLITYEELRTLSRSQTPAVRETVLGALREIDLFDLTIDEIGSTLFERPTIYRQVAKTLEDGTKILEDALFYIGLTEADRRAVEADEELEELGVSTGGGGGGGGGGYYAEEITSDQYQRIRAGEITIEEAEWENDPDNYDEYGDLRPYGEYADEDELDDEGF